MRLFFQKRSAKQQKLVEQSLLCLGKKYKYGAQPEEAPTIFDCSSLVQYLYKQIGITLPRSSIEQAHFGKSVNIKKSGSELAVGDLLFFTGNIGHYNQEFPQGIGHVAISINATTCIEATGSSGTVITTALSKLLARKDLVTIKRIL